MKKITLSLLVLSLSLVACAEDNQKAGASSTAPKISAPVSTQDSATAANGDATSPKAPVGESEAGSAAPAKEIQAGDTPVVSSNLTYTASIKNLEAGVDYPTDAPIPKSLVGKKALLISGGTIGNVRYIVEGNAVLAEPEAGIDYPTDSPNTLAGKKVLVLGSKRIILYFAKAEAGVDYPTETAPVSEYVLVFSQNLRIPHSAVRGIIKAEAGVDYPTETAADFYVALSFLNGRTVRSPLK